MAWLSLAWQSDKPPDCFASRIRNSIENRLRQHLNIASSDVVKSVANKSILFRLNLTTASLTSLFKPRSSRKAKWQSMNYNRRISFSRGFQTRKKSDRNCFGASRKSFRILDLAFGSDKKLRVRRFIVIPETNQELAANEALQMLQMRTTTP